jgi:NitT/TauT family transport system substrate-binding protein
LENGVKTPDCGLFKRVLARSTTVIVALVLGVATSANAVAAEKASVRLKWVAQAQFVGFYVAKAKGYYDAEGLDLTINPGGPNLNGETLVASNADNFAVAGGIENLLASRAKGLPIVGIGMMLQRSPSAYVAYIDSGIKTPNDFKGKTVSTFFTGAHNTLAAVLAKQGVGANDVKIVPQAVTMTPFLDRQVDVATVMLFNELNVLRARGLGNNIVVISPEDYGVSFPSDAVITNETMIKDRPKVVQGFMNASLRGWKYAIEHQDEAIDILMKVAPGLDRKHQAAMLAEYAKLVIADAGTSRGVAVLDVPKLEAVRKFQLDRNALEKPVTLTETLNTTFWDAVPVGSKKP